MTVYLDYCATTPVSKPVADTVYSFMLEEFGNAGSRTHEYGARAKQAVESARLTIANALEAKPEEIVFTSGATESNNIAILGLQAYANSSSQRHIISCKTEHKAVIEPILYLESLGFEVTWLEPNRHGEISLEELSNALREETLLASFMHVNNETGVIADIEGIASVLTGHKAFFHIDAAQSFGKFTKPLRHPRIDMVSISGHKIYAPMGVGALLTRRRGYKKLPLEPLFLGGGQERGLRPGTVPVPLIAGLGKATELALKEEKDNWSRCESIKSMVIGQLTKIGAIVHGRVTLPYMINFSIPGCNSEAMMVALKGTAAISNGSACTSSNYSLSHVLESMCIPEHEIMESVRISWSPFSDMNEIRSVLTAIGELK